MPAASSAGSRFRAALVAERPLQIIGTINAYHARMAQRVGYRAIYLSGGGVAAGSLGVPDLGISTLDDVLTAAGNCPVSAIFVVGEGGDLYP